MKVVAEISFEGLEHSNALAALIDEDADKLCAHQKRISSLRVVVSRPQHRHHKGDVYQVHIHATAPDVPDVIVTRELSVTVADDNVYAAFGDASRTVNQQLQV